MFRFLRNYFFTPTAPSSTIPGHRFLNKDQPKQKDFEELFGSIGFLGEKDDAATTTEQGFVRLATDQQVIDRNSLPDSSGFVPVVQPHQIPIIEGEWVNQTFVANTNLINNFGAPTISSIASQSCQFYKVGDTYDIQFSFDIILSGPGSLLIELLIPNGAAAVVVNKFTGWVKILSAFRDVAGDTDYGHYGPVTGLDIENTNQLIPSMASYCEALSGASFIQIYPTIYNVNTGSRIHVVGGIKLRAL